MSNVGGRARATAVAALLALAGVARADDTAALKQHCERGLSAFALHHFAEAAEEYEAAFALRADPALLYDAAQAHRLAGHDERALELYRSYLRLFGERVPNRENAQQHVVELQRLTAQKRASAAVTGSSPASPQGGDGAASSRAGAAAPAASPASTSAAKPNDARLTGAQPHDARPDDETPPSGAALVAPPRLAAPGVAPPASAATANARLVAATPPPRARHVYEKPWFWAVLAGGAAVVAAGVGLGVGLSAHHDPLPTLGATTVK